MFLRSCFSLLAALGLVIPGRHAVEAQITAVAAVKLDSTGWNVTADSAQLGNNVSFVLDKNTKTFWHSQYTPTVASLPHSLVLDMMDSYMVNGYTYLPRQDGSTNGNIGQHTIEVSLDNTTWTTAASGTWVNDQTLKTTYFAPQPARFVRLTAQTEASGTGKQFTSAAEVTVLTNPQRTLSRAGWAVHADSQENTGGETYNGTEAVDGAVTTYWQTKYTGALLPHYFTIDQGKAVTVGGLTYLPRPISTGSNGTIGSYLIQRSTDNKSWTTFANGTWADNPNLKTVEFAAVSSRYIRLVALTEAGNRGAFTSAAEFNLLDGSSQLNDFQIIVDSQETAKANNSGIEAMDGDLTTFWSTAYSTTPVPGFPHYITIDMQAVYQVHALTYTPRQDKSYNGNIGDHQIDVSSDGTTWTKVAKGSFIDNKTPKLVNFQETPARYVRLTANSEAGNRGPWTSAAEVTVSFDTSYSPPPSSLGQWGQVIDFPIVPVAAALIPSTGKILTWASYKPDQFTDGGGLGQTQTATYDYTTGVVSQRTITNTSHDMFCPGLSVDFNGRPFVTGGNTANRTSVYDPGSDSWSAFPVMNIARGYQASQTLMDGRIFTIGGSWSGGRGGKNGEVFSMANNSWSLLPGCPVAPMLTADLQGVYRADNHAWLFAWSNSTVFQAGPSKAMNWYTPTGYGGVKAAGLRAADTDSMNGNAVMYDAVAGKILTLGGATSYQNALATWNAHIITISAPNTTALVTTIKSMAYRRAFANAVVLPDGSVFVVGGQEYADPFTDDNAILYPELWNPTTQQFTIMAPMVTARTYHSIALLQPDATVISGGGGLCAGCSMNHFDAQIFSPPYLFNADGSAATRPVITSVNGNGTSSVAIGGTLIVSTDSAVQSFALIRTGSATHTVDTDQRRIPLTPLVSGVNTYTLQVPSDPGVALPGMWMVFAINSAGVPSVAQTIKITPTAAVMRRSQTPKSYTGTRSNVLRRRHLEAHRRSHLRVFLDGFSP